MKAGWTVDNCIEDVTDTLIQVFNDHQYNKLHNVPNDDAHSPILTFGEPELIGAWKQKGSESLIKKE